MKYKKKKKTLSSGRQTGRAHWCLLTRHEITLNDATIEVRTVAVLCILVAEKRFEDVADNSSLIFITRADILFFWVSFSLT